MPQEERRREIDGILAKHFEDDARIQQLILDQLGAIQTAQADMLEMLTVFNNIKGFAVTMRGAAMFATWLVVFAGSLTAIGYGVKQWLKS